MTSIPIEGLGKGLRSGAEFEFTAKPGNKAASTFTAITSERVIVTHYFSLIEKLPPNTPVIAHWHGQWRTEAFLTTVGELAEKAKEFRRMTAPRLRLTFKQLPPGFARAPEAGDRVGLRPRMVRNHASQERVALMVVQPTGGLEYAVHADGFVGLPRRDHPGDTGDLCDGRRVVATFAALTVDLWPGDTGPIDAARRAVANLGPGDT